MNLTGKSVLALGIAALVSAGISPAFADHRHWHGHGEHERGWAAEHFHGDRGRDHDHVRFGLYFGAPLAWGGSYWGPFYDDDDAVPYFPPVVTVPVPVPTSPPTYIEQTPAPAVRSAAALQPGYWYYCAAAKAYYPYVRQCAGGWQRVAPQPSR